MTSENPKHASNPSSDESDNRQGGGVFIALGAILGVLVGGYLGQPSVGLLSGLALGIVAALAIWLKDR
ncbi:hypothetical protein [Parasphingorhabdus sp.]|uniref:hypothetical protein n=1 Tax=Parasphingorhabdus sp. TaxID=2709688 RepID=UPI003266F3FA